MWVAAANRWRNPDEDLPVDFEDNRDVHYEALRQPLDPTELSATLQREMTQALAVLEQSLASKTSEGVRITTRRGEPWVRVSPSEKLKDPQTWLS